MRTIKRIFVATILTTFLGTVAFAQKPTASTGNTTVHGDEIIVLGKSYVAIHHKDQENFRFLRAGQIIDVSALSNLGSSGPK